MKLFDKASGKRDAEAPFPFSTYPFAGDLFAECPVPNDVPVQTVTPSYVSCHIGLVYAQVVEPVLDSSRYYVIKIVDPHSEKHAFIGIGFR